MIAFGMVWIIIFIVFRQNIDEFLDENSFCAVPVTSHGDTNLNPLAGQYRTVMLIQTRFLIHFIEEPLQ